MSRTAFAGWQIPASEMVRKGLDPEAFFSEIRVSGYPMTRIVQEVKSGEVDVGFVATCLLERMARAGQIDQKDFRVIGEHADRLVACRHSTELYPNWFFSIKPSVPTSVARTLTATLLDVPAAPDGTQWTISNDNRRLFEVFRVLQVPYGNPDDFGRFVRRILPWVVGAGGVLLILLLNTLLLARLASHRARALEKAMDEKLRAELAAQQNAVQIESLTRASAVGLLSSMVAHELKQPLTVIGNYAGSLRRRLSRGEVPHETLLASITEIEDSGTRAAAIIDRVRSYGQVRTRSLAAVDLSDLVKTAVARWRRHSAHRVPCTLDLEPGLTVEADRLEIELAVLNIVKNAAAAVKDQPDAAIAHGRRRLRQTLHRRQRARALRRGDRASWRHRLHHHCGRPRTRHRHRPLTPRGPRRLARLPPQDRPRRPRPRLHREAPALRRPRGQDRRLSRRRIPPLCFQLPRFPCGIRQNA